MKLNAKIHGRAPNETIHCAAASRTPERPPPDEFGVTHHDVLFNEEENKIWCVLDAPNKEAVEKHHEKAGLTCEWIREVESSRE